MYVHNLFIFLYLIFDIFIQYTIKKTHKTGDFPGIGSKNFRENIIMYFLIYDLSFLIFYSFRNWIRFYSTKKIKQ